MKYMKRILALAGVGILLAMYGSTLFFALSKDPDALGWLMASIGCTIIIPVFLYIYILIYRYINGKK